MTSCATNIPTATGDSPQEGYRTGPYTNNPGDIKDRRAELRLAMHKKVSSLSFEEFMDEFVPDATTLEPAPPATGKNLRPRKAVPAAKPVPCPEVNPYKGIGVYANERGICGSIVKPVFALWNCIIAHKQAMELGIVHQDISAGNMRLYHAEGAWQGLLNDWELSKTMEQHQEKMGRQPDRTGTWQFMSVQALNDHTKTITIQDELESFFHVLLYLALRLLPHNCLRAEVPRLLYDFFDDYAPLQEYGCRCGQLKLNVMTEGSFNVPGYVKDRKHPKVELTFLFDKLADDVPQGGASKSTAQKSSKPESLEIDYCSLPKHPLDDVVRELLCWFGAHYTLLSKGTSGNPAPDREEEAPIPKQLAFLMAAAARDEERSKKRRNKETGPSMPPPASEVLTAPPVSDAPRTTKTAEREAHAKKLESHGPMSELLWTALLKKKWPEDDRCVDRMPKKRLSTPGRLPASSASPKGAKRDSAALGDDAPRTPSKRSKAA